jgi:hypothetical protein
MLTKCDWSNVLEPYLNVLLAWHDILGLRSQNVQSVIKVCRQEQQVTIAFLTTIEENYNAKKKQYKESSALYFLL